MRRVNSSSSDIGSVHFMRRCPSCVRSQNRRTDRPDYTEVAIEAFVWLARNIWADIRAAFRQLIHVDEPVFNHKIDRVVNIAVLAFIVLFVGYLAVGIVPAMIQAAGK